MCTLCIYGDYLTDKNRYVIIQSLLLEHLCYSYKDRSIIIIDNKQLLDEVEHDSENYQGRGLCYLPKPKAEADNTDTRFW